jgi:hypothetical protein
LARIDLQILVVHIDDVSLRPFVFNGSDLALAALGALELADCCVLETVDLAITQLLEILLDFQAFSVSAHAAGDNGGDHLSDSGHDVNFLKLDFLTLNFNFFL